MSNKFNLSKSSLSIAFPSRFQYNKKEDSLHCLTFESVQILCDCYPAYLREIFGKRCTAKAESLINYTGDVTIRANEERDAYIDECFVLYLSDYRYRTDEYKNPGHMINAIAMNAVDLVVRKEMGKHYQRIKKTAIGADGKPYKYLEYISMSEQRHEFDEDGRSIDTWDIYPDSLRFYPYVKDTAETAVNNIAWKDFYLSLTDEDKKLLSALKESAENSTDGKPNKSAIARDYKLSHTVINRRTNKLRIAYDLYMKS